MYQGASLQAIGRDEDAVGRYRAAAEIFRAGDNRRQEFEVHMNLGATLYNLEKLDEAATSLARAAEIGKVMFAEQQAQLATVMTLLGMVAHDRRDYARAIELCTEGLRLAEIGGPDYPDLNLALTCLTRAHRVSGHPETALPIGERAVQVAERQPIPEHRYNALLELARTLAVLGRDRPRRIKLVRKALELDDLPERRAELQREFRKELR
jgi:tetratricopeptide (TPR) repeat protein